MNDTKLREMKKEYKKPNMDIMAFETSYGVMQVGTLQGGGNTSSDKIPEAYSKQHDFTSAWEDDEDSYLHSEQ